MGKKIFSQFLILATILLSSSFSPHVNAIIFNQTQTYLIAEDNTIVSQPNLKVNQLKKLSHLQPQGRYLQQQLGSKSIEDLSQKDINSLQSKELVVIRQKPQSRKFTITDIYTLQAAARLAEDINGKVIYQRTNSIHSDEQQQSSPYDNNSSILQLKSLNAPNLGEIDYLKVWAKKIIKMEKQLVQSRLRILKNQIDIAQEQILKFANLPNSPSKTKNDSLNSKNDSKNTSNDSNQILNDGFPIADSDLPQKHKNDTVQHLPFCIVIPSYNNAKNFLYKRNINSILQQEYSNYHVVYIDDKSQDNTTLHVINYLKEILSSSDEKLKDDNFDMTVISGFNNSHKTIDQFKFNQIRWTFVQNTERKYALQNIYYGIHQHCQNNQIAVILDGDDALVGTQALSALNQYYKMTHSLFIYTNYLYKKQISLEESFVLPEDQTKILNLLKVNDEIIRPYQHEWEDQKKSYRVTHVTSYEKGPAGMELPFKAIQQKKFRSSQSLLASHLLTFYVSLFKKIDKLNFTDDNNEFFKFAYDRALTLPLAELVPAKTYFVRLMLYEYSADTGINDSAQNWGAASLKIRQKSPLEPLRNEEIAQMINSVLRN